jgi:hypothetical protein
MNAGTEHIRELFKGAVGTAQGRIQDIEKGALKVVKSVQDRFRSGQAEGTKKLEEVIGHWKVKDLLEKLKADEVLAYGVSLRKEISERLGFVLDSDFAKLGRQVETLRKEVAALRTAAGNKGRDGLAALQKQVQDIKAELGRLKKGPEKGSTE